MYGLLAKRIDKCSGINWKNERDNVRSYSSSLEGILASYKKLL